MPPTYRAITKDQIGDHFLVAHLKIVKLAGQIQVLVLYRCKYDGTLDYIYRHYLKILL